MALNFHSRLLIILALLAVAHCSSIPSDSRILGGYVPVDPKDPHVHKIALFAVYKYNQLTKSNYAFMAVLKAEKQIVAGTNYRIALTAMRNHVKSNFQAIVYEDLSGNMYLRQFKPLKK